MTNPGGGRSVDFLLVCPSLQGRGLTLSLELLSSILWPRRRGDWDRKTVTASKEQRLGVSVGTGGQVRPGGALPCIEEALSLVA